MQIWKEFLKPKGFSNYGYFVVVLTIIVGTIIAANIGFKDERDTFSCESHKSIENQDFLKARCFDQYDQQYNSPISLYGFVVLTFSCLLFVCISYSWCLVKSNVDQIEEVCTPVPQELQQAPRTTSCFVFWSYLIHLLIRCALGAVFVIFQIIVMKLFAFPSEFYCKWHLNSVLTKWHLPVNYKIITHPYQSAVVQAGLSFLIDCHNSFATQKKSSSYFVCFIHIVLAFLVLVEAVYLILKAYHDKNFMYDYQFCKIYLLNKGNHILVDGLIADSKEKISKQTKSYIPFSFERRMKSLDDTYVDLHICSGRIRHKFYDAKDRHERLQVHLTENEKSTRINNIQELFLSEGKKYNTILIVGRPGIGKSLLCTKIMRKWSKGTMFQNTTKVFKYLFLFRFRHLNSIETTLSLREFLGKAEHSVENIDSVFQSIFEAAKEVLIVFDGLDEYKDHEKLIKDEFPAFNHVTDKMPVSCLYVKLLEKKLLAGATVVTTTRPHTVKSVKEVWFDRDVEILGFTPEKVKLYIDKDCKDDSPRIASKIWEHIRSNANLLYLCYIPANCNIVCGLLKHQITNEHCISLPTTLTDVYNGALRIFILEHHPAYKPKEGQKYDSKTFLPSVENELKKLGFLAKKGIENNRLTFEEQEVDGLKDCGLLHSMPGIENLSYGYTPPPQYCFLHLTLQEFLAARQIVKNMRPEKIANFIKSKVNDSKWHLVIEFIAGLVSGKAKCLQVKQYFVDTFADSQVIPPSVLLLIIKCLYELLKVTEDDASHKIKYRYHYVTLHTLDITAIDCTAIAYVLKNLKLGHLKHLYLSNNRSLGDGGCSELASLLKKACPENLQMEQCNITDDGVEALFEKINWNSKEACQLKQLSLSDDKISDRCVSYLCDHVLNQDSCKLESLSLVGNEITDKGMSSLCTAMIKENCKLTRLLLRSFSKQLTDKSLSLLSSSLKHKDCLLTRLSFSTKMITDEGIAHLCETIRDVNCKLDTLKISVGKITDKGIKDLCNTLRDANCKLKSLSLDLEGNGMPDYWVSSLRKVLEQKNCTIAVFKIFGSKNASEYESKLIEAIKRRKRN